MHIILYTIKSGYYDTTTKKYFNNHMNFNFQYKYKKLKYYSVSGSSKLHVSCLINTTGLGVLDA